MLTLQEQEQFNVLQNEIETLEKQKQILLKKIYELLETVVCRSIMTNRWKISANRTCLECTDHKVEKQIKDLFNSIVSEWWNHTIELQFKNFGIFVDLNDNELTVNFYVNHNCDFATTIAATGIEIDEQSFKNALANIYLEEVAEARNKICVLERVIAANEAKAAEILNTGN